MDNPTTKNGEQLPGATIQVLITVDQVTGGVNVQGPVGNLMLMYGILEAAKDVCRKFVADQNAGKVIVPAAGMPNLRM
jgi:hypothetical protein